MKQLEAIETYLLDMDGTFYLGDQLYPWSLPFVETMRRLDKKFIFVTKS